MPLIKTKEEIQIMHSAGKIAAEVLDVVLSEIKPGITTLELDNIADALIIKKGGEASFKKVKGYKHATCININEGLVHGIPNSRIIKPGDIVKVDLGVFYKGYHSDISSSKEVETSKEQVFLERGQIALDKALEACIIGNRVGDISYAMQSNIEKYGYSVSRELVGHGIGKTLHEEPYVPCYGKPNTGILLKEGMVLAIEIIYQKGSYEIGHEKDGWTIITKDRSIGGLFEHTVAITKKGPFVLTRY